MQSVDELLRPYPLDLPPGDPEPSIAVHGVHYSGCQDDGRDLVVTWCSIAVDSYANATGSPADSDLCAACVAVIRSPGGLCPACGESVSSLIARGVDS